MNTKTWLAWAGIFLILLTARELMASGACTAARMHDWQCLGCNQNYTSAGGAPPPNACPCQTTNGMPRWTVNEPYITLSLHDKPMSYTMSSGKEMSFEFYYRQSYGLPEASDIPNFAGTCSQPFANRLGGDQYAAFARTGGMTNAAWANNWMMDVIFWDTNYDAKACAHALGAYKFCSSGYEAVIFRPEGGTEYFYSNPSKVSLSEPRTQATLAPLSGLGYPTASLQSPDTNGIYWGNATNGFSVTYPDGSQDIFGYTAYAPELNGAARAYLTQRIDPQGRVTSIGYEFAQNVNYNSTQVAFGYRVRYVVDPDSRTNTFLYYTNSSIFFAPPVPNPWMLTEIDDPYGRKVQLQYQMLLDSPAASSAINIGVLSSITDAAGLSNSFQYAAPVVSYSLYTNGPCAGGTCPDPVTGLGVSKGWITNLATPYGNTAFDYYQMVPDATVPDGFAQRAIYISEPTGAQQLYYYLHKGDDTNGSPLMATAATSPSNIPGVTNFDNGTVGSTHPTLEYRNTIFWGRRQCAALSSNVLSALPSNMSNALAMLTANDFRKGRIRNWLWQADSLSISESLSSEREPSSDSAGQIEDTDRIWYSYPGQSSTTPEVAGTSPEIACTAQMLPDGSSQFTTYNYYPQSPFVAGAGMASDNESSYSKSDGTIGEVTNWFAYAGNSVDLLSISNSAGQYLNFSYDAFHQLSSVTNSLNQVTSFSYDLYDTWNLTAVHLPSGESISLSYYWTSTSNVLTNMLQEITFSPQGRTFTINNYSAGLPSSITDDRGLTVAKSWDGLNRLTGATFPDLTTVSNVYNRLDLAGKKDRLGNWTYYSYDGLQHLTVLTNADTNVTSYSYCGCGSLEMIVDPQNGLTHPTYFNYDNRGNLTNIIFPDASALNYQIDSAGRTTEILDDANRYLQFSYNNQGLVTNIASAAGTVQAVAYDAMNRATAVTDADGVTVTNAYDLIGELLKCTWPDGGAETFGYSPGGLNAYTNRDSQKTFFNLDGAGRIVGVTNANHEVNQFVYDSLNNVTDLYNGNTNHTIWQYNEYGWLTNKINGLGSNVLRYAYNGNGWITNRWMPEKGNTIYHFDNVGNLKSVTYPASIISYSYDALNRLTNMSDLIGSTAFAYTPAGDLQSENGPWTNDTVSFSYAQGLRTNLNLSQPGGAWSQSYAYDSMWRMVGMSSPVGQINYTLAGTAPASFLIKQVSLPNGASISCSYDSLARLTGTVLNNYWGHTLDGYTYTPDALGLRTNITRNLGIAVSSVNARFDNIGQLTSWTGTETNGTLRQNEQLAFLYDPAHNLHSRTNGGLVQSFTTDKANQLTTVAYNGTFTMEGATPAPATNVTVNGGPAQTYRDFTFARTNITLSNGINNFTNVAKNLYGLTVTNYLSENFPQSVNFSFDNNGNLTNDGTRTFMYDAENQLTNIIVSTTWRSDFVYDGLNRRRIEKDYAWQSGTWVETNEFRYIYDELLLIQERNSNNIPLVTYTRGLDLKSTLQRAGGIGGLLARTDTNGSTFYHSDGAGNITALMDQNENIVARYLYNPFGKLIGQWGVMANANTMQFSSMSQSHGLTFYPYRSYDSGFQRFLSQDPAGEYDDVNLYATVGNDPIDWVDSDGLGKLTCAQVTDLVKKNNKSGLDDTLIKCIIYNESKFDPDATTGISGNTAAGLMGVTDGAASDEGAGYAGIQNKMKPDFNIQYGSGLLGDLYKRNKKNLSSALYQYGPHSPAYGDGIQKCSDCLKNNQSGPGQKNNPCDQNCLDKALENQKSKPKQKPSQ